MKEKYQLESDADTQWDSLAEMPDFVTHEATLESNQTETVVQDTQEKQDSVTSERIDEMARDIEKAVSANGNLPTNNELERKIGSVVDEALRERAEQGAPVGQEDLDATLDLGETQELKQDILNDNWRPEFDESYHPRVLSEQEKYDQIKRNIEKIDQYLQRTPEQQAQSLERIGDTISTIRDKIRQYRENAEARGIRPEEIPEYNSLYTLAGDLRQEQLMLEGAKNNRRNLKAQQVRLGRELVKGDPLYHDAFEGMDQEVVNQNMDAIINSTPPREFEKLAKLIDRKDKQSKFQKEVQDVLIRSLGLEDANIDVKMYNGSSDKEGGYCKPTGDGYLIGLNAARVEQDMWLYAKYLAHEMYHVMQGQVRKAGGTDMAELYDFNMEYYGNPTVIGHAEYKRQLNELEAFTFMDRFLNEIRNGDMRNQQKLPGRIKRWWRERDTVKLPDNHKESMPDLSSEDVILMKTNNAIDAKDSESVNISK